MSEEYLFFLLCFGLSYKFNEIVFEMPIVFAEFRGHDELHKLHIHVFFYEVIGKEVVVYQFIHEF